MARKRGQNEGSIFQRKDGQWVAAISLAAGRKVAYGKTRREAADKLLALQQSAAAGRTEDRKDITVRYLMSQYLEYKGAGWSEGTYARAEIVTRLHIVPHLGAIKIADLGLHEIAKWLRTMGATRNAQIARGHLSGACSYAVRCQWLATNPVALTDRPKAPAHKPRAISKTDIQDILAATQKEGIKSTDTDYYPLTCVLLGLGLRIGEALGLRWKDWDAKTGQVSVSGSLKRGSEGYRLNPPKTAAGRRTLKAPVFVAAALEMRRATQKEQGCEGGGELGLIFTTALGTPMSGDNVRRGMRLIFARSGIEWIRLHDHRHAHVSLLFEAGVPLTTISNAIGHADTGITAKIYAHHLTEVSSRVAAAIDAAIVVKKVVEE